VHRSDKWFSKISELVDDDEDEGLDAITMQLKGNKDKTVIEDKDTSAKKAKAAAYNSDSDDEPPAKKKRGVVLTPEELAMGEAMIHSSKTRKDLEDWAWNRYTNNDEGLPDWFVDDEKKHFRAELPVTKERVEYYKQRQKELNARPIKKVVEAKMRKQKRQARRLEKAKKQAENLVENENMEHGEKVKEMKKVYRKALRPEKKEVKYQVMTKGKRGKLQRPSGPYKVVDKRLKKDNRNVKKAAKSSKDRKAGKRGKSRPQHSRASKFASKGK